LKNSEKLYEEFKENFHQERYTFCERIIRIN